METLKKQTKIFVETLKKQTNIRGDVKETDRGDVKEQTNIRGDVKETDKYSWRR